MVPMGAVKDWADTIPCKPLLDDLSDEKHRRIVMPAEVREADRRDTHPTPILTYDEDGRWWTELTCRVPALPS